MQPSTGRAVVGAAQRARAYLLVRATYSIYLSPSGLRCDCDATAMRLVVAALGVLIAHRVTRRRALLLPCCSQWALTRDIPETLFVDCGRKGHVLNTPQARRWNYPSFPSLCFVLSQPPRSASDRPSGAATFWKPFPGVLHGSVAPAKAIRDDEFLWTCLQGRGYSRRALLRMPGPTRQARASRELPARQASTRQSKSSTARSARNECSMFKHSSYSNNKPCRCGFGSRDRLIPKRRPHLASLGVDFH